MNFESRAQLIELTGEIRQTRHNLLIMADYEGGRVQRFRDGFTVIPPMATLGRYYSDAPGEAPDRIHFLRRTDLVLQGFPGGNIPDIHEDRIPVPVMETLDPNRHRDPRVLNAGFALPGRLCNTGAWPIVN